MSERLPKGVRKNLRNKLAEVRKSGDEGQITSTERQISETRRGNPRNQLSLIEQQLAVKDATPDLLAAMAVERVWLRFASEIIDAKQRKAETAQVLDDLEENNPTGYESLMEEVSRDFSGRSVTRLMQITDRMSKNYPKR